MVGPAHKKQRPIQPRRQKKIRSYVYPDEYEQIVTNARLANMSLSMFLRQVAIGMQPKATIDQRVIGDMGKIAADLNRLGGLLKLWLTDETRRIGQEQDIRQTLTQIESFVDELRASLKRL